MTITPAPDDVDVQTGDLMDMIEHLKTMAEQSEQPHPIAAGTFALYPMGDGGMMFVTSVAEGMLAGLKHTRIPPGLIRAVSVLAGGGSKLAAIKALTGLGRKEIDR
jgi:hypothetical protein